MREYHGLAASKGTAIGSALLYLRDDEVALRPDSTVEAIDPQAESVRLEAALAQAEEELAEVHHSALSDVGEEAAAIFLAHQEFLSDPVLLKEIRK